VLLAGQSDRAGTVPHPGGLFGPLVEVTSQEPVQDLPLLGCGDARQVQLVQLTHQAASETRLRPRASGPTLRTLSVAEANDLVKASICISLRRFGWCGTRFIQLRARSASYPTISDLCPIFLVRLHLRRHWQVMDAAGIDLSGPIRLGAASRISARTTVVHHPSEDLLTPRLDSADP
jgi:hypothetical protein